MDNSSCEYQINKNVFTRYENNINNGTFFMYDICSDELWTGNQASYIVLRFLKERKTLQALIKDCRVFFNDINEDSLMLSIKKIINELVEKGFIEKYDR